MSVENNCADLFILLLNRLRVSYQRSRQQGKYVCAKIMLREDYSATTLRPFLCII